MLVENYVVRGSDLVVTFSDSIENAKPLVVCEGQELAFDSTETIGHNRLEARIDVRKIPSSFRHIYSIRHDGKVVTVGGADKLVPIFYDKELYHKSGYIWIENRHSDAETNAFIAKNIALGLEGAFSINCTMGVVFGYKALELQDANLCDEAVEIIGRFLEKDFLLFSTFTVREDRWHLRSSMLYCLFLLNIFRKRWSEVNGTIERIWNNFLQWNKNPLLRTTSINIIKPLSLYALVAHYRGENKDKELLISWCYEIYLLGLACFKADAGVLTFAKQFAEGRQQADDVQDLLFLRSSKKDDEHIDAQLQYHSGCVKVAELEKRILSNTFRSFGAVNEKMANNLLENISQLNPKVITENLSGLESFPFVNSQVYTYSYPEKVFLDCLEFSDQTDAQIAHKLSKCFAQLEAKRLELYFECRCPGDGLVKQQAVEVLSGKKFTRAFEMILALARFFENSGELELCLDAYTICGRILPYNTLVNQKCKHYIERGVVSWSPK